MKIRQDVFEDRNWITLKSSPGIKPQLVLCFGKREILTQPNWYTDLRAQFPDAAIISTSSSGEVSNKKFTDDSIVATALEFEQTNISVASVNIKTFNDSSLAGNALAAKLPLNDLRFVLLFSDGILVNGGDLIASLSEALKNKIPVAGGMAGDGESFIETVVGVNNDIIPGNIVAIGFYGDRLNLGFGSKGGWSRFGPLRCITNSNKNVLYELDGENALNLYKKYLGKFADKLPGSALHFPLALSDNHEDEVVRTILNIDEENKTMTFAGNMPVGASVRFMKTTPDSLFEAAASATRASIENLRYTGETLSILISCVGRKIVLGSRIDEEIEAVRHELGENVIMAGFFSHGEISPHADFVNCSLHNQTITITTLSEVD